MNRLQATHRKGSSMRLLLEPTAEPRLIDGVLCRLWTGHDEDGIPVHACIIYVSPQTHDPQALREFAQRLHESMPPIPIGMIYSSTPASDNPFITGHPGEADADDPIPPVTAPPPYAAIDPDYDEPDAIGIT